MQRRGGLYAVTGEGSQLDALLLQLLVLDGKASNLCRAHRLHTTAKCCTWTRMRARQPVVEPAGGGGGGGGEGGEGVISSVPTDYMGQPDSMYGGKQHRGRHSESVSFAGREMRQCEKMGLQLQGADIRCHSGYIAKLNKWHG